MNKKYKPTLLLVIFGFIVQLASQLRDYNGTHILTPMKIPVAISQCCAIFQCTHTVQLYAEVYNKYICKQTPIP